MSRAELKRIRRAYRDHDLRQGAAASPWPDRAKLFHLAEREWQILRRLEREGLPVRGARVLDVGCGSGHVLERFLAFGARQAVGADLLPERLQAGKEGSPRLELVAAEAGSLPFADGSFDLVVQFMCLSAMLDEGLRQAAAREMWRLVRPGGAILLYELRPVPVAARVARSVLGTLAGIRRRLAGEPRPAAIEVPFRPLDRSELERLFPGCRPRPVSLDLSLAPLIRRSPLLAQLLGLLPGLRCHFLGLARKPER